VVHDPDGTDHSVADLRDRARYWGWTVGAGFGEPFVTREEVGLRSLRDLI
jgi:hypothetical protein